jgi:hypothetical protein
MALLKPSSRNIPVISDIRIALFSDAMIPSLINLPDGAVFASDIPFPLLYEPVYFTPLSASFSENEVLTANGPLFNKELLFRCPQSIREMSGFFSSHLDRPFICLITDADHSSLLSYPLFLSFSRQNQGTAQGFKGYSVKFTGSFHHESHFVVKSGPDGIFPV